jgi:DNA-directed RNA polymerase I subunit RPA49
MALGEAFGSKRSKAAIQAQLNSHVDAANLESVASQIFDNVKAATANIPSQGNSIDGHLLIADALADDLNADRPIPAIDLTATNRAGLYSLDSVVSEPELSMIDAESIYALPDEAARIAAVPFRCDLNFTFLTAETLNISPID